MTRLLIATKFSNEKPLKMLVQLSACSPCTPTIRVRDPFKPAVFFCEKLFEMNENKQTAAAVLFKTASDVHKL